MFSTLSSMLSAGRTKPHSSSLQSFSLVHHKNTLFINSLSVVPVLFTPVSSSTTRLISPTNTTTTTATVPIPTTSSSSRPNEPNECSSIWSLYDDLYHDTLYADSEFHQEEPTHEEIRAGVVDVPVESKKRKVTGSFGRQYRDDCLYVCDWPGCVHLEEKETLYKALASFVLASTLQWLPLKRFTPKFKGVDFPRKHFGLYTH
ncbi:unnamed protein product [Vicia faba]|uniref:Uncharacterized protein n=1 Tax=Vicia faba TaxID=3906 RepID=A0AAV0ZZX2_VICFA|nr:unnamed protein product [Vicia faba]